MSSGNKSSYSTDSTDSTRKASDSSQSSRGEEESSIASSLFRFFDENGRYIQYAAFGLGVVGLVLVGRSLRLTTRFDNMSLIPDEFFSKNITLYGRVRRVDIAGSSLLVDHTPIINVSKSKNKQVTKYGSDYDYSGLLTLHVPGLKFNSGNAAKLQSKLNNKTVKFTLIEPSEAYQAAFCLIFLKGILFEKNFAIWCLRNRLGTFSTKQLLTLLPDINENKELSIYYKKIIRYQRKIEKPTFFRMVSLKIRYFILNTLFRKFK